MSIKEEVIAFIQELPEDSTVEDIMYKLYVRAKIEEGIKQLEEGQGLTHHEAITQINRWLLTTK